jgi:ABC-type transport system involved in cytochrome c biogenesis permease subunit
VGVREVESMLGLAVVSVFFIVWWLYDAIALGIFVLPITFFTVLVPALGPEHYTFPSAGVRNSWLAAHIAALLTAYVALSFSLLASVLYLLQERRIKRKHKPGEDSWQLPLDWLPPLDTLERIAQATLEFGSPCITVGLVIGSVLAQATPLGAAYFIDPKVIASFAMWAVYVALLFVRRSAGLRGRRAAYLCGVVFLVMLAVFAANFISRAHRYGP